MQAEIRLSWFDFGLYKIGTSYQLFPITARRWRWERFTSRISPETMEHGHITDILLNNSCSVIFWPQLKKKTDWKPLFPLVSVVLNLSCIKRGFWCEVCYEGHIFFRLFSNFFFSISRLWRMITLGEEWSSRTTKVTGESAWQLGEAWKKGSQEFQVN